MAEINQAERAWIMKRLANGNRKAIVDLADLYQRSGYHSLAQSVRLAVQSERAWVSLQEMARQFPR